MKRLTSFVIAVLLFFSQAVVFADDFTEEECNNEMAELELQSVSAEVQAEPSINSKAAIVIDRESKRILYKKNENDKRAMASTTKIMTCLIALENSRLDEAVVVSKKAASIGGSRLGLSVNDKISMNDLIYGLMLRSGNDAAMQIAETVGGTCDKFAEMMNKKANEIGLINTHFVTPHGLDDDDHYTTAHELAILTDYALNNKKFAEIVNCKRKTILINGKQREIYNTNELLR